MHFSVTPVGIVNNPLFERLAYLKFRRSVNAGRRAYRLRLINLAREK
jgi:hypothetical protein